VYLFQLFSVLFNLKMRRMTDSVATGTNQMKLNYLVISINRTKHADRSTLVFIENNTENSFVDIQFISK